MKRYGYIDAIRGISIILVCLGHVFPMVCAGTEMNPVWRWFNIFEVGIFFAVSGYLTAVKNAEHEHFSGFGAYAWKKIKGLLWPYITFSILALVALGIFYKCNGIPAKASLIPSLIEFASLSGIGALWFLPTLCVASLIAYPGMKNRVAAALTVAVAIALTYAGNLKSEFIYAVCGGAPNVWVANIYTVLIRSLIASGFVVMGYYLMPLTEKLMRISADKNTGDAGNSGRPDDGNARRLLISAVCIALTVAATPLTGLDFRKIEFSGQPILIFISVGAMMAALVLLLKPRPDVADDSGNRENIYSDRQRNGGSRVVMDLLEFFGQNSLIVLATHLQWFIVDGAVFIMRKCTGAVSIMGVKYYAQSAAVLIIVLAAEYVIIRLINRFAPWLVKPVKKLS